MAFNDYMTMDANRKKPTINLSGMNSLYAAVDPKAIAKSIQSGDSPPDISQYGRPAAAAIASEITKLTDPITGKPYSLTAAQNNWNATKKLTGSLNNAQQLRLSESFISGNSMLDNIDNISQKWDGMGLGPLSRANLTLAQQGGKGSDAQTLANQLSGQIAQLTSDIATIEQGGLTPTNESRAVADKAMQAWWGNKTIQAMTEQARTNIGYREHAKATVQPQAATLPGAATSSPVASKYKVSIQ